MKDMIMLIIYDESELYKDTYFTEESNPLINGMNICSAIITRTTHLIFTHSVVSYSHNKHYIFEFWNTIRFSHWTWPHIDLSWKYSHKLHINCIYPLRTLHIFLIYIISMWILFSLFEYASDPCNVSRSPPMLVEILCLENLSFIISSNTE